MEMRLIALAVLLLAGTAVSYAATFACEMRSGCPYDQSLIVQDANGTSGNEAAVTSQNFTLMIGNGDNRILVVGFAGRDDVAGDYAVLNCTANGVNMTRAENNSIGDISAETFYLVNPASGSTTVICRYGGTLNDGVIGGVSLFGVDQNNPIDATNRSSGFAAAGTATYGDIIVPTTNNTWVFENHFSKEPSATLTAVSGQTLLWKTHVSDSEVGALKKGVTTTSYNASYRKTSAGGQDWIMTLVALRSVCIPCLANQTMIITLNASESGTVPNNSHAALANYSTPYSYGVCCWTDSFRTMNNSCTGNGVAVVKLFNATNSHMQAGNMSGYAYNACLNTTLGSVACEYPNSACSAGYNQVMSIASSETADANLTNAHAGEYGVYKRKVCCQISGLNPPTIAYVSISPYNTTTTRNDSECQNGTTTDPDGNTVTLHYNWIRNGTSQTVLNLPMSYNGSHTFDISGFNRHGTLVNGTTFLPTGGKVGGGMQFDGVNDYITAADIDFAAGGFSWSVWFRSNSTAVQRTLSKYQSGGNQMWMLIVSGVVEAGLTDGTSVSVDTGSTTYINNEWHFAVVSVNTTHVALYMDGVFVEAATHDNSFLTNNLNWDIGRRNDNAEFFNGSIDELIIWNRSLSAAEILTLNNSHNRFLNGTELVRTEGWNCSITPVDSTGLNGSTVFSNMSTVNGSPPLAVTLTYPVNNNNSVFERYVNFSWSTANEPDGDQVNYTLNATVLPGACSVSVLRQNLQTTSDVNGELCTDQYYNWTVNACDIDGCAMSSQSNFTIASVVGLRLIIGGVDFGTFNRNQTRAPESDPVGFFTLNNTGNVRINITLNASNNPFSSVSLPTTEYQVRAEVNATSAFNQSGSQTTYSPLDVAVKHLIKQLNYTSLNVQINSTANIYMNITAPINEPPGSKQGNFTVYATAS